MTVRSSPTFPTTCWSLVIAAGGRASPESHRALATLCEQYWFPLYAYLRRRGNGADDALDLTQGYFLHLIEREKIGGADAARGRFRTFLLADFQRYLADDHERRHAAKRGSGVTPLSIDARDAEGRFVAEPAHDWTPERQFERDWALSMLDGVLLRLRGEYEATGRGPVFEALKSVLTDGASATPYAELGRRLGTTPGAVQVAAHRLRRRFRELVRDVVAATVEDESGVDQEIEELFRALGS